MTPLRAEEISLLCEDRDKGRSEKLIGAAVQALRRAVPFAQAVQSIGVSSKNDVQVRTKFARAEKLRVFGVRDRDYLLQSLVQGLRASAFARTPQDVKPWPLSRHSIESYLLDDDVLSHVTLPTGTPEVLRAALDRVVAGRQWLDAARGTLEDLAFRVRRVRQEDIEGRPADRSAALAEVERVAQRMRLGLAEESQAERLTGQFDALAADMMSDGPLRCRVDGRELIYDLETALGLPRGFLLDSLTKRALLSPPVALVADIRTVLEAVPASWRDVGV